MFTERLESEEKEIERAVYDIKKILGIEDPKLDPEIQKMKKMLDEMKIPIKH